MAAVAAAGRRSRPCGAFVARTRGTKAPWAARIDVVVIVENFTVGTSLLLRELAATRCLGTARVRDRWIVAQAHWSRHGRCWGYRRDVGAWWATTAKTPLA